MSEHAEKGHPFGAFVMLVIIVALMVVGFAKMNSIEPKDALLLVPFFGGYGIYVLLGLAKAD